MSESPTPDELDKIIASKAAFDAMFWRAMGAIYEEGTSANEISRRLAAAKIASRPTTLAQLRPYKSPARQAGEAAQRANEAMQRMGNAASEMIASTSRLVAAMRAGLPINAIRAILAHEIAEMLGDHSHPVDVDAVLDEIERSYVLGDRPRIHSIHEIPAEEFWDLIKRHTV